MSLPLRKKLIIVFALGLLGIAAIGYFLFASNPLHTFMRDRDTNNYAILEWVGSIRAGLKDIESAEIGYALSGEQNYLIASREISALLRRNIEELKKLSSGIPTQAGKVEQLSQLVEKRIQFNGEIITARSGDRQKKAYRLVQTGIGRHLSEEILSGLTEVEQNGFKLSAYQDRLLEQSVRKSVGLIAAGYGVVFTVILLSIFIIGEEFSGYRKTNRELKELKERFRVLTEGLKDCSLTMLAADGAVKQWGAGAERLQGFTDKDILGRHYSMLFPSEDLKLGKPQECLKKAETEGWHEQIGVRMRKDGSFFHAHSIITALRDPIGNLQGYSVVTRDITSQIRSEDLLKKLALTVEQAADLVVITDRNGKVEYVNRAVEEVTGYARDEFLSSGLGLLHADKHDGALYRTMWEKAVAGFPFQSEMTCVKKNGGLIYVDQMVTPIVDEAGRVTHVVFTGTDRTPVKLLKDKLDYLSSYDALTGLPNRDLFAERLNREMSSESKDSRTLTVLAIDIDRFKYLNEIYGLDAGNKVLKQVAESLSVSVNKGDIVGRLGSDEFGIVLHDAGRPTDAILFVKMIMKNVPQIVMSGGEEIAVTLAVGIAVYPGDGKDARTLMKNADTALSKAKDLGRNQYQFYTTDMNLGISELVFMERRLSEAMKNKEYTVAYQPYHDLATKKVAGAEALLRWNNNEFGLVSPAKFIPMLEETGMIADVGKWVLKTACMQIREWADVKSPLPVAVNLSPSQFKHEYLVQTVENIVRETGINPRLLTLEITESTFMKDQDFAIAVLQKLRNIGVRISIDDFGTGYSSLSYLKKFPVDTIKIDQSFIKDVALDPDTTSLVTAIIAMAHSLGLKTIAEGVENEEQWKILRLLKCDMGQGFYLSAAVPPKEFDALFA